MSRPARPALSFGIGAAVRTAGGLIGLVSSLLGVAGGELIIPVFILLFGVDVKVAGSMSMLVGMSTSAVGLLRHFGAGSVLRERAVWRTTILPLGLGSVLGAILGALALGLVPSQALQIGLGVILIWSAWGVFLHLPERGEALAAYAQAALARVDAVLAEVPEDARPPVYLARGLEGLEAPARGSINAESVERVGATNVVQAETRGLVTPSLEQVIAWAPDTIITIDGGFAAGVRAEADWQAVPAVAEERVFLAPAAPFGWIDAPPSVNRLIGLSWLLHTFYPDQVEGDLRDDVPAFYRLFWQVDLDEATLEHLLEN